MEKRTNSFPPYLLTQEEAQHERGSVRHIFPTDKPLPTFFVDLLMERYPGLSEEEAYVLYKLDLRQK